MIKLKQAAEELGVSRITLISYIKRGVISAFRTPGGHYTISREALDAFKARMLEESAKPSIPTTNRTRSGWGRKQWQQDHQT